MNIHHIAIWTQDIKQLSEFYSRYFNCIAGERYKNPKKNFESVFLSFPEGAGIELMSRVDVYRNASDISIGLAHFAIHLGSVEAVDVMTKQLECDGVIIESNPRYTGDGYYESVVLDPDGNRIELTAGKINDM